MNTRKLIFTLSLILFAFPVSAQVNDPKYKDYFLMGRFGEVCTMCEIIVLCEHGEVIPNYESIPGSGTFTLYHIQTRTFWSQVSTIWEWFVKNFSEATLAAKGHTRPVYRYVVTENQWAEQEILQARIILEPGRLEFGEHTIDRVEQSWLDNSSGEQLGYCQRLPLWDSLEQINAQTKGDSQ
ncbi:hypothetical protein [Oceanicoccus sp. KOV_DT_Chl]|uniref:hypothetical protein n=1 Tax=Oceanicoccus sp. KOV_DT_Chl TaxID=1904639 RepID=UPI000C7A8649|nr:hypothetical protein [Oceanicoccus sp. KOV_DT_Chl]